MKDSSLRSDWVEVEFHSVLKQSKEKYKPNGKEQAFYIGLEHIEKNTGKLTDEVCVADISVTKNKFSDSQILYGKLRPYLNKVYLSDCEGVCSTDILVFDVLPVIKGEYALNFLLSRRFVNDMSANTSGVNLPRVSTRYINSYPIPLPPLPEQRKIVAKIEELFSRLDYGINCFKAAQEKLTTYRQLVLKKAFEGELTREWREQQTNLPDTDESLKQINTELDDYHQQQLRNWQVAIKVWKAAGKEGKKPARPKKYKGITELTKQDLSRLPELPNEWCWQKLDSVCQKIQIGPFGSQMHRHEYVEKGVPVVNPQHIKSQKIFPQVFISEGKAKSLPQYVLEENDIVLGRRGEMGRSACISPKENSWFCGSGSLFIRLGNRFNGVLYSLILSERRVVHYLEEKGSGTTMTNLNSTILSELPVQLIPLEEQVQITKEIESRFSVCDHLQQAIDEGLQKAEALRQSVLKKAFEGRLLTEAELANCRSAPDWEPAQQLLACIQAEKRAKHKTENHPSQ